MDDYFPDYPNRTMCDALEEMRKCVTTLNFASMMALIEEIQSMGNRMEARLGDKRDVENWTKKRAKLKCEINDLMQKKQKLKGK